MQIKSSAAYQDSKTKLKNPWLAVNLSIFCPGIGQIYAGESAKGITLLSIQILLMAIAFWSLFSPTGNTIIGQGCLLPILIIYLASIYDAHYCVKKQFITQKYKNASPKTKDPWFAAFLSQLIPGLGHLYIGKVNFAAFFLSLIIVFTIFANSLLYWLVFSSILSAVACYHVYIISAKQSKTSKDIYKNQPETLIRLKARSSYNFRRDLKQNLIIFIAIAILTFRLVAIYLPNWIDQQFEVFQIPSESMVPTLIVGDRILVKKSHNYHPKRGDLIVFKEPDIAAKLSPNKDNKKEHYFIKRVVGEPGENIKVKEGFVYVNDHALDERYITEPPKYEWEPGAIPSDFYCVLGDNRNNSFDSHVWGFLNDAYIVGKAYKIFWPRERIRSLLISG